MADESSRSYELSGPFRELNKNIQANQIHSLAVRLRSERNPTHVLNPVGHLRRVVSGQHVVQEAILLMGVQFFEIFSVVQENQQVGVPIKGIQIKSRIKSVANTAQHISSLPIPKRFRNHSTEEEPEELTTLERMPQEGGESILKDHVFSVGVAFAQVVKVICNDTSVTVFYHPNSMKPAKLSKNNLATAMRFTFCLNSIEEATKLLKELEKRMTKYQESALFLGEQCVLPSTMHIVAVTQPLPNQKIGPDDAEVLLCKDAPWGVSIAAPDSWGAEAQDSDAPLWAYLMTPLGYGKCEISPQTVSLYKKGKEAKFFVGVRHPNPTNANMSTVSNLREVRGSEADPDAQAGDDEDDSEEDWQPEDSDESMRGTPTRLPTIDRRSTDQRSLARGSRGLHKSKAGSAHEVGGRHIRLHCSCKYVSSADDWTSPKEDDEVGTQGTPSPQANGLKIRGGLDLSEKQLSAAVVVLALIAWRLFAWSFLPTALNALLVLYILHSRHSVPGAHGIVRRRKHKAKTGVWRVTLIKAEIVSDEPWSAAGESIAAEAHEDDSDESAGERRQRIAREYGFSDDVVERYMLAFKGDESMAHRKMRATYEWKKENDVANILHQPQPNFPFFKKMFRHALLGTTKDGHPVWFMKVGDMKVGYKTFKDSQLTMRDLARHVSLCMDYMYNVTETAPLPNGRALWVLDLKGMGMGDMGGAAFDLGKEIAGMIAAHWPERLYRAFVINMPGFFSILWKLIEPLMAQSTRKKIRLLRGKANMLEEMKEEMDEADIPAEYGGQLQGEVYNARKEKEFWEYVEQQNNKH